MNIYHILMSTPVGNSIIPRGRAAPVLRVTTIWSILEIISAGGKLQTVYNLRVVNIWNHLAITDELYGHGCMKIGNNALESRSLDPGSSEDETWKLREQRAQRNIYFRSGNCIKPSYIRLACIINIILCKCTI